MGFFNKTPEEKEEKILRDEQKADDKAVKQALKDVERANKAELKAAKDEHNAVEDHQKAIRRVDKLAADLIKLQQEQEAAISQRDAFEKNIEQTREEHARLHQLTIESKQNLEILQAKVAQKTAVRNERLEKLTSPVVTGSPGRTAVVGERPSPQGSMSSADRVPTTEMDTDKAALAEKLHMERNAAAADTAEAAPAFTADPPAVTTSPIATHAPILPPRAAEVAPVAAPTGGGPLPFAAAETVVPNVDVPSPTLPTAPPRHPVAVAQNTAAGLP